MTNFERFNGMDSDTFAEEIQKVFQTPFRTHIDWKAYMKGESENPQDYFISEKTVRVVPSEMEIVAALGKAKAADFAEYENYRVMHTKVMPLLEETSMFGRKMYTVADTENNRILKVPEKYVETE